MVVKNEVIRDPTDQFNMAPSLSNKTKADTLRVTVSTEKNEWQLPLIILFSLRLKQNTDKMF